MRTADDPGMYGVSRVWLSADGVLGLRFILDGFPRTLAQAKYMTEANVEVNHRESVYIYHIYIPLSASLPQGEG